MILIVAEKPSVARDIAKVLKATQKGEGFLRNDKYIVSWALGHLVTLCEPDEMDEKYKKWRMQDLPIIPSVMQTKVIKNTASQYKVLKNLMQDKEVESLICATDAGREGELIFRLIYEKVGCNKPFDRLWISSMTDEAIKEGFSSLRPSSHYEGLYNSAKCRAHADWIVGMNLSRAFTLRYNTLLSIGRVQTPTLNILVKRFKEIEAFVPEEYHTINVSFKDFDAQYVDENITDERYNMRIENKEKAAQIVKDLKGKIAHVRSCQKEDKREIPPQLYDLTSLQREANKSIGFTADKTLKVAQSLYEKYKMLTYPRTDSRYLPLDMQDKAKQTLSLLPPPFKALLSGIHLDNHNKLPLNKRIFDNEKVSDHHAIIPTPKTSDYLKLPPDEKKLFDMVAKRTIAAFYPPFLYEQVRVFLTCETHTLKATGRTVQDEGWKKVYQVENQETKSKTSKKQQEATLPPLTEGEEREVLKVSSKKDATKPPLMHTDASLLAAMENAGKELTDDALREQMKGSGMGTPATRAAIIERLLSVKYAERKGKNIVPTQKGVQLIDIAPDEIASPEMTGKWELALNEIAENKRDTLRFMQGIEKMTAFLIHYAKTTTKQGSFPVEERRGKGSTQKAPPKNLLQGVVCPFCKKEIQETDRAFGCSAWQSGCHFTLWKDCLVRGGGPKLTKEIVTLLFTKGCVQGSTGAITVNETHIAFFPKGKDTPSVCLPLLYER